MRTHLFSLALFIVPAACGDGPSVTTPDGAISPDVQIMPTLVTVDTQEPPTMIVYRSEESSSWQTPRTITPTTFELAVTGPYRVTVVCAEEANGLLGIWQAALTPEDPAPTLLTCDTKAQLYTVTGTMVHGGSVALDSTTQKSSSSDWSFELPADAKTYALVATSDDRILIRRGLAFTGNTEIEAPIDAAVEGTPFATAPLSVTNLEASETVTTARVWLETGNTNAFLYRGAIDGVKLAPQDLLENADKQIASVSASGDNGSRYARRSLRAGDPTTFVLPERLGPVTFAIDGQQLTASWSTLPAYDFVEISLDAFVGDVLLFHDLEVSRKFIETTGITKATIDTASLPGFHPEWRIDTSQEHTRFVATVLDVSATESSGSSRSETANAADNVVHRALPKKSVFYRRPVELVR
jgi:hypothetical protein